MSFEQRGKQRLLRIFGSTDLYQRTETAYLHRYGTTAFRVRTQYPFAHFMLQPQSESALYNRVKEFVKMIYLIVPHGFSLGNIVELLLDIRRKVIIENIGEILRQEIVDDNSYIGGEQFAFIGSRAASTYDISAPFLSDRPSRHIRVAVWSKWLVHR